MLFDRLPAGQSFTGFSGGGTIYHILVTFDNEIIATRDFPNRWRCQAAMRWMQYSAKQDGYAVFGDVHSFCVGSLHVNAYDPDDAPGLA